MSSFLEGTLLAAWRLGVYTPPDRKLLESLLPDKVRLALSIGCNHYTKRLRSVLGKRGCELLATLDRSPDAVRWAGDVHYTGAAAQASLYYGGVPFDLVLLFGVVGFGCDSPTELSVVLSELRKVMQPKAWLIFSHHEGGARAAPWARLANPYLRVVGRRECSIWPFPERTTVVTVLEKP